MKPVNRLDFVPSIDQLVPTTNADHLLPKAERPLALQARGEFDVVIDQKELSPRDPTLIYYPLIYLHGRAAFSFTNEDLDALRRHLEPGGGTLFGDAACASPAFDAAFRRFVTELLPNNPLVPIPRDDELYSTKVGFDLGKSRYANDITVDWERELLKAWCREAAKVDEGVPGPEARTKLRSPQIVQRA